MLLFNALYSESSASLNSAEFSRRIRLYETPTSNQCKLTSQLVILYLLLHNAQLIIYSLCDAKFRG